MSSRAPSFSAPPPPVVARVQGHALGGGAGLVATSDIAIASPETVFSFSEVKLGIIPAVISPFLVEMYNGAIAPSHGLPRLGGFLASRLINQGYDLTLFKEDEINLETAFMALTKGITA